MDGGGRRSGLYTFAVAAPFCRAGYSAGYVFAQVEDWPISYKEVLA
jgi:hypothetical protein